MFRYGPTSARLCGSVNSVVVTRLKIYQLIAVDQVQEPVLLGDPPGPRTLSTILELLGLADAGEGIAKTRV
jgi:hypothetical protein